MKLGREIDSRGRKEGRRKKKKKKSKRKGKKLFFRLQGKARQGQRAREERGEGREVQIRTGSVVGLS